MTELFHSVVFLAPFFYFYFFKLSPAVEDVNKPSKLVKFPVVLEYCLSSSGAECVTHPHAEMKYFGILCHPCDRSLKRILGFQAGTPVKCRGTYCKTQLLVIKTQTY